MERENGTNIGDGFADRYLEKLIQVPFKIPALGDVESHLYIVLLMIGSKLDHESKEYKELIKDAIRKLAKPWDIKPYNVDEINGILGNDAYKLVQDEVMIALQISPILYEYSRGNPRVIKRFINMLLLRYEVAQNRGFGENIKLPLLAKLMLAERNWPKLHENIALHLREGIAVELGQLEEKYLRNEKVEDSKKLEWLMAPEYVEWIKSKPSVVNEDLRPYYIACKERKDFLYGCDPDEMLRAIVSILMMDEFGLASHRDDIKQLTEENASKAFEIVASTITAGDLSDAPVGFAGLKVMTELHPALRKQLVDFVSALPCNKVESWIVSGWDNVVPKDAPERTKLEEYFKKLKTEGTSIVKKLVNTPKK